MLRVCATLLLLSGALAAKNNISKYTDEIAGGNASDLVKQFADWVPVTFSIRPRTIRGATKHVPEFTMCKVDFAERARDPPKYPMFRHITMKSGCDLRGSKNTAWAQKIVMTDVQLASFLDKTESAWKEFNDGILLTEPEAMIYHQSRCGSTLTGNLFLARPDDVVYSEPGPVPRALKGGLSAGLSPERITELVKLTVRAWGRVKGAKHMYIKWTSFLNPNWHLIGDAFPKVPFVYLHRHPVEVISSLLNLQRDAELQVKNGADPDTVMARIPKNRPRASCFEDLPNPRQEVLAVMGLEKQRAIEAPYEQYCAAHIKVEDDYAMAEILKHASDPNRANGTVVDYKDMPFILPHLMREHFGYELGETEERAMVRLAGTYSKNWLGKRPEHNEKDSSFKQETAPRSVHKWSETYTAPMYNKLNERFGFKSKNTTDIFSYYGEAEAAAEAAAAGE